MNIDVQTLVELIVCRAKTDKTAPDHANSQNSWRTDALFQDIDAFVVGQNDNPFAFSNMGKQVFAKVRNLPEIAVLAQLAILRGERLLLITPEREKYILQFAMELDGAISLLPESPKKWRCKSLFEYNMGVFYSDYGRLALAIAAHERAAKEAERFNDQLGAAISRFLEILCRLKGAVKIGGSPVNFEVIFLDLEWRSEQLFEAVRGTSLEVQWTENGLAHMKEARELLKKQR